MKALIGARAAITVAVAVTASLLFLSLSVVLGSCASRQPVYKTNLKLEKAFGFRPKRLPTGGAVDSHPCLRGDYNHVYRTDSGQYGRSEVWLCCVPVSEILNDSFNCGGSAFPTISISHIFGGDSDYWKIRGCSLLHPTASEPTFIPVCIPAPLSVDTDPR